jgi:SAM-dependent methyltransferase
MPIRPTPKTFKCFEFLKEAELVTTWIRNNVPAFLNEKAPAGQGANYILQRSQGLAQAFVVAKSCINPGFRILDVGGGSGYFGILLEEFCSTPFHYEILEAPGIRSPRFVTTNLEFDGEHLPYPDQSFDCVLCTEVIEHLIRDPYLLIAEINRCLRIGGSLVISTPNLSSLPAMFSLLRGRNPVWNPIRRDIYGRHNKEYTFEELNQIAASAGFSVDFIFSGLNHIPLYQRLAGRFLVLFRICPVPFAFLGPTYLALWTKQQGAVKSLAPGNIYFDESQR